MKHRFLSLLVCVLPIACRATPLEEASEPQPPAVPTVSAELVAIADQLPVQAIDLDLDEGSEDGVINGGKLWEVSIDQDDFPRYETRGWYERWTSHRAAVQWKAEELGFDGASLRRCFDAIEPGPDAEIALVPIGAFLAKDGDEPVWILPCAWEYAKEPDDPRRALLMAHIRIWAVRCSDGERVDFVTCG